MSQVNNITDILNNTVNELGDMVSTWAPKIVGVVAVLLVGVIFAKIIRYAVSKTLSAGKIGDTLKRKEVAAQLKKVGIKSDLPSVLSKFAYWMVLLVFLTSAADSIGLGVVRDGVNSLFGYIPNVVSAVLILGAAAMLARLVNRTVAASLMQMQVNFAGAIANVASSVILLFGAVMAVTQLGFDTDLITNNITVILAGIMGALVLGIGLGSKGSVDNLISGYHGQQLYRVGQKVSTGDVSGKVVKVTNVAVVIESDGQEYIVPFSRLMK